VLCRIAIQFAPSNRCPQEIDTTTTIFLEARTFVVALLAAMSNNAPRIETARVLFAGGPQTPWIRKAAQDWIRG
jgi:hypothetical protein